MALAYLGIDIAKAKFNVCLLQANGKLKHKVFLNSNVGFRQLSTWLQQHQQPQVHACLEATGTYGEALALYLHDQGQGVSLINPAAIKAFAASCLSRTKTDRVDAELIAGFVRRNSRQPGGRRRRKCASYRHLWAPRGFNRDARGGRKSSRRRAAGTRRADQHGASDQSLKGTDRAHRETDSPALGPASRLAATARLTHFHSRHRRDDGGLVVGRGAALEAVPQCPSVGGLRWPRTTRAPVG